MLRPAIREARLLFGRHDAGFRFPSDGRPAVIAGPNGSGKSTLVEGLVRTLFGYERRRAGEAASMEARKPWATDAMAGEVILEARGEAVRIRRDFVSDRVRVDAPATGVVHFEGDGNPGATNQEARHYRRILTDLFGLADLDAYQRTLYIRQGDLPHTTVGDHLLRLAAGGHVRVDGARRDIAETHRGVTRRPIHPAARPAVNPRELEKVGEEIAAVRARLDAARRAGERRGPIALERDRAADRLDALDEEIRLLEDARSALARGGSIEMQVRQLREWSRKLDRAAERLARAGDENEAAEAAFVDSMRAGRYPDDFPARVAAAELRWKDMEALGAGTGRWPAIIGLLAALAASGLWIAGEPLLTAVAAGVALLAGVAWVALRLDARRRRRDARGEIAAMLEGVPDAETVSPRTRSRHLALYHGQRGTQARRAEARADLAAAARDARGLLLDLRAAGLPPEKPRRKRAGEERPRGSVAQRLQDRVRAAAAETRDRMARTAVDLERLGDVSLQLPDGVPPTEADVAEALAHRRRERSTLQDEIQGLGQELLERGTPSESGAALEAALAELIPRRDALDRKARALEAAHALVADAYDAFRARDQERLLADVSRHAAGLTSSSMAGVEIAGTLEEVSVRMGGRTLPLTSPPLSFGELHGLLLAVRLGAADFLAGVGILPPLIVDEPFAHLDRERAAAAWSILRAVASERQVILTTQDELVLEALGIDPDLRLPPHRRA